MPPSFPNARGMRRETIEVRRARGEASCAECRRNKQKCDKAIPCSTCVRRGCQDICPNGTQDTGPSTRLTKAESEELRHKLLEMSKRIRQLEDALQVSHHTDSTEPHPLLVGDLLDIKSGIVPQRQEEKEEESVRYEELLDSFGTLSVSNKGGESYNSGYEVMICSNLESLEAADLAEEQESQLPASITYLSNAFPFTPLYLSTQELLDLIESKLPTHERATALVEAYLEHLSWFFKPVDREQIIEIMPAVYQKQKRSTAQDPAAASAVSSPDKSEGSTRSTNIDPPDPHTLALLLAVFACGAVADLTNVPWNSEANLYYHLARTAIAIKPVFDGVSLHSVQAISLIAAYNLFSLRGTPDGAWKMWTFAMSLAASIGLHRDPSHFKLSPKQVQRRRQVFWELYAVDTWKGIGSGRPQTFTDSVVDCEFPEDRDATLSEDGDVIPSFWRMRYMFVRDIVTDISTTLSSVKAVKYSEILRLDKKIREFGPPRLFDLAVETHRLKGFDSAIRTVINQVQMGSLKDSALVLIHRNFFARFLVEDPSNPSRSRFSQSFVTIYYSSSKVLRTMREQFDPSAHFLARIWPIWGQALSAGLLLGAIAVCGNGSELSLKAFEEFELAFTMFSKMQMHPIIKGGLPILLQLRDQARQAHSSSTHKPSSFSQGSENEEKKRADFLRNLGKSIEKGNAVLTSQLNKSASSPTDSHPPPVGPTGFINQPQMDVLSAGAGLAQQFTSEALFSHACQASSASSQHSLSAERGASLDVSLDLDLQQYPTSMTSYTQAPAAPLDRPQPQLGSMGVGALNFTSLMNEGILPLPTHAQLWDAAAVTGREQSGKSYEAIASSSRFILPTPNSNIQAQKGLQNPFGSYLDMDRWAGVIPSGIDNAEFDVNFNMDSTIDGGFIPNLSPEDLATLQALLQDVDSFRTDGSPDGIVHD